ncbi:transmembrane protein 163a isoform X1 [Acipenser ruthenus]|uniref:transmembrane protein 163a isoform X1 n=2 Tax=Acipenser ruthenus TaxID=7906 RepID=UPI00145A2531|nr:transmembrane protein 163a isoform X1 [Acipenser ruthenus]
MMTDSSAPDLSTAPNPTILDPAAQSGQCAPTDQHPPKRRSQRDPFSMDQDQEMKISESVQFSDEFENRGLLESSTRLKPHEAQSYRKKALWVSWVSILVTIALAVAAFTVSIMRHSASAFGFAFDAVLDVLSSIIVLWRYSNAAAVHSAHREYIACVVLGVVFILSSMCIVGKAIHDLATKLLPEVGDFLFSVSILSGILCIILAVVKFMLGRVLTSRALITDAFNSLVGGIMGFSILISAEVFKHHPNVWYLDGMTGVLIGLIILAYGVKLLIDMVPRVRQTHNYETFE